MKLPPPFETLPPATILPKLSVAIALIPPADCVPPIVNPDVPKDASIALSAANATFDGVAIRTANVESIA